jgi:hypothetical protein
MEEGDMKAEAWQGVIEERDMMFVRLISGTVGIWEYTIH